MKKSKQNKPQTKVKKIITSFSLSQEAMFNLYAIANDKDWSYSKVVEKLLNKGVKL